MYTVDGQCPTQHSVFLREPAFFLLGVISDVSGTSEEVRKVRPGVGADTPKQIGSQLTFHPPTPHSLYSDESWDSLFLTTLDSKKRKGTPPVIFKKEIHKSLHRF